MRHLALAVIVVLALLGPGNAYAATAPAAISATVVDQANSSMLMWTDDATAAQWYININGIRSYTPFRTQTFLSGTSRAYIMYNLPKAPSFVVNVQAVVPGAPVSAESPSITVTASAYNFAYIKQVPGDTWAMGGGSGGGALTVTVANTYLTVTPAGTGLFGGSLQIGGALASATNPVPVYGPNPLSTTSVTTNGSALYLTYQAAAATPGIFAQAVPQYVFAACNTCTAGAKYVVDIHMNRIHQFAVPCSVTVPTNSSASLVYLSPSSKTKLWIESDSANTQTVRFLPLLSNSIPANASSLGCELAPGATRNFDDIAATFLYFWTQTGTLNASAAPVRVWYQTENYLLGQTSYPQ